MSECVWSNGGRYIQWNTDEIREKSVQFTFFPLQNSQELVRNQAWPKIKIFCCSFEKGYTGDDKLTDDGPRITEFCIWQYSCCRSFINNTDTTDHGSVCIMGELWDKLPLTWTDIFRDFYQSLLPKSGILLPGTSRTYHTTSFPSSQMASLELVRPFLRGKQTNTKYLWSVAITRRTFGRRYW